jgi:mannose-6-phosphate isomerase-like protein (cupin superfamily)
LGFKIIKPATVAHVGLEPGRGHSIQLVDGNCGTDKLDVHINVLLPNGPRGRIHRHSVSDNVYIVKSGEGELIFEGTAHRIVTDDVVFIPSGARHALSNLSAENLVIYEIYAPAGPAFDFVTDAPTAKV